MQQKGGWDSRAKHRLSIYTGAIWAKKDSIICSKHFRDATPWAVRWAARKGSAHPHALQRWHGDEPLVSGRTLASGKPMGVYVNDLE